MAKKAETTVETEIPPRPEMDPQFGDKTPALVEWIANYAPEEFAARYQRGEILRGGTAIESAASKAAQPATSDQ